MSTMPSATSISGLGFSSALALQTNSMRQCLPSASDAIGFVMEPKSSFAFATGNTGSWGHETSDAQFSNSVTVTGETSEQLTLETMYLLVAYSLLRAMPNDGLEETCQSLRDIFEFHSERSRKAISSPPTRRLKVKLRQPVIQSGFRIEED